jgi:preprotein translocase subunit SecF
MSTNRPFYRNVWFWLLLPIAVCSALMILVFCATFGFNFISQLSSPLLESESITQVALDIQSRLVRKAQVNGSTVFLTYKDGHVVQANFSQDPGTTFEATMRNLGVTSQQLSQASISYANPPQRGKLLPLAGILVLTLLAGGVYFLVLRLRRLGALAAFHSCCVS